MNKCRECGNQLNQDMLFCNKCGTKIVIENTDQYSKDVNEEPIKNKQRDTHTPSNKKSKIGIITLVLCLLVGIGAIVGRKSLMYNYYIFKANTENEVPQSVEYYAKALNLKYSKELVDKINDKTTNYEDFESLLDSLYTVVKTEDLNQLYLDAYVHKAKENFKNKNYETALKYLSKAQEYNYNIEDFEYYYDLKKIKQEDDNINSENSNNDTISYKELYGDYIISDSNIRYLTEDELVKYSKDGLAYVRNEIFARHGYIFKQDKYFDYFYSKSWYNPNPNFKGTENELNQVERANIKLIKKLENSNNQENTISTSGSKTKKQIYSDKLDQLEKEAANVHEGYGTGDLCTADYVDATGDVYQKYDKVLNDIYQDLKKILPSDSMSELKSIQLKWIEDKEKVKEDIERNEAGTHINWVIISTNDYMAEVTKERCYELLNYFN